MNKLEGWLHYLKHLSRAKKQNYARRQTLLHSTVEPQLSHKVYFYLIGSSYTHLKSVDADKCSGIWFCLLACLCARCCLLLQRLESFSILGAPLLPSVFFFLFSSLTSMLPARLRVKGFSRLVPPESCPAFSQVTCVEIANRLPDWLASFPVSFVRGLRFFPHRCFSSAL